MVIPILLEMRNWTHNFPLLNHRMLNQWTGLKDTLCLMGKTSQIPVKIFQTNQSAFQSDGLILLQPILLDLLCWVPKNSTDIPCSQFWWMFQASRGVPATGGTQHRQARLQLGMSHLHRSHLRWSHPFEMGGKWSLLHMAISFWPLKQGLYLW